jgi:hypothetical protein
MIRADECWIVSEKQDLPIQVKTLVDAELSNLLQSKTPKQYAEQALKHGASVSVQDLIAGK